MATKLTSPVPNGMAETITKIDISGNAVTDAVRNLRAGPVTVKGIEIENTKVTSNTAVWVKFYNTIDNSFVAGTSKPVLVIPLALVAADPITAGVISIFIPGGLYFSKGVSVLTSQENGDTMTTTPATDVDVYLITD